MSDIQMMTLPYTTEKAYGVYAPTRAAVIETVLGFGLPDIGRPFLRVEFPCGAREYATEASVPVSSEECLCGTLPCRHWFVYYGDEATT